MASTSSKHSTPINKKKEHVCVYVYIHTYFKIVVASTKQRKVQQECVCGRARVHRVCVRARVCVTMKKKSARRMASTTSDTGDTSSKQQQCVCVCVCVCVCARARTRVPIKRKCQINRKHDK